MITVIFEPEGTTKTLPDLNTAQGLLNRLGLRPSSALVIRGEELLTPDRKLKHGDTVRIRTVGSRG